jgi:hypothetical protein
MASPEDNFSKVAVTTMQGDHKDTSSPSSSLKQVPSAAVGQTETHHLPTYEHEKALVLKFDLRILPVLAFMYLCKYVSMSLPIRRCTEHNVVYSALDKGNLGNAKTNHLEKDLHFRPTDYNTILSIFYIPYVIFAPPIGMLGKKYGPSKVCVFTMSLLVSA